MLRTCTKHLFDFYIKNKEETIKKTSTRNMENENLKKTKAFLKKITQKKHFILGGGHFLTF